MFKSPPPKILQYAHEKPKTASVGAYNIFEGCPKTRIEDGWKNCML